MKIDTTIKIVDLDGTEIPFNGKSLTAGTAISHAILNYKAPPERKVECFQLAVKLTDKKEVELTKEQVDLIKEIVKESGTVLSAGRIYEILGG